MAALQEPAVGAPAVELAGRRAGFSSLRGGDYPVPVGCDVVYGNESMREEDWAGVRTRLERVFFDRCYVRQLSKAKDNWLELPVGKVTAGILSEVKRLMMKR